jgi:hypothetical protein
MENQIIIGLGGTGGKALKAFRKRLCTEFDDEERAKLPIGFVYVDSTEEMMKPNDITFRVHGKNAAFDRREFVNVKGVDLDAVFRNPNGFPGLKGFIGDPEVMQKTIGALGEAAGQKRKAGRILFGGSIQQYLATLRAQYAKVKEISENIPVTIHIITGLAGGTGSGSIIDVIAQTRKLFPQKIDSSRTKGANIVVYCMTPEVMSPPGCEAGRYHANGFAALTEINALAVGKYLPHDVEAQTDRIKNSGANGVFVYTNANEYGRTVDSFDQLPNIVSDVVYSYAFLEQNNNTQEFIRAYTFENIDDCQFEFNEKTRDSSTDVVRSKAFGSFGIKRVIIPEEEIIEYFTYRFGGQALLQIRYNNWNDDQGFLDRPKNMDFNAFVRNPQHLERWLMTDRHLTLDQPVLRSDKGGWTSIDEYWDAVIPLWTQQAKTQKMPFQKLEEFCSEVGYANGFRTKGVQKFFEGKTAVKEEHASEIIEQIQQFLFEKLLYGDLSLYDFTKLIDELVIFVNEKRAAFNGSITDLNQKIDKLKNKDIEQNKIDGNKWYHRDKTYLTKHETLLKQYYKKKTQLEGKRFGIELMANLLIKLNSLKREVDRFVSTVNDAIQESENQAATRCKDEETNVNIREAIVRFYNHDAVVSFTKTVEHNKQKQENLAGLFRHELLKQIGSERTFSRANAEINKDKISQIFDTLVRETAISIHDDLLIEDNEKLINRNILEQLSERYSSDDDLKQFALDLVQKSGVNLTFDDNEIKKQPKNNPIPKIGVTIFRKIVLINLPKIVGNETVQRFATRLQNALLASVDGNITVKVDTNGTRKNEMTIISLTYCFPLRAIFDLTLLKEKYDYLVNDDNAGEARRNRTILHTEGTGENFPNLFVEDDLLPSQIREKYTPYVIIAYAMGLVKYGDRDDGTGKSAYGTIEINRLGSEVLNPIADKFTEIPYQEQFSETFGEGLREKTSKALKEEYLNVNKRAGLILKIQELYQTIIVPEFDGNQGSKECRFFSNKAETAIDIIEKS